MQELIDRIKKDGKGIGTDILKVDSFINHQLDVELLDHIGAEFFRLFRDEKPNKILTVESSGIAIACSVSRAFGYLPVVFAKKSAPSTMIEDSFTADVMSFTKGKISTVRVAKQYLGKDDKVLIIDDFLASGAASAGLVSICDQAGAKVAGFGAVIEKEYQGGAKQLREKSIHVESLAMIKSINDEIIEFC